jgi:hypothetical protein
VIYYGILRGVYPEASKGSGRHSVSDCFVNAFYFHFSFFVFPFEPHCGSKKAALEIILLAITGKGVLFQAMTK